MSGSGSARRDSEHPLFRVLVLMGSSLALGCGGSAIMDGSGANGGAPAAGGTAQGGAAHGGGGANALGGSAGDADCPPAQWECSALGATCSYYIQSSSKPAGCVCDRQRPRSVADCGQGENLLCLSAYREQFYPEPQSWDGTLHVQCACVPGPAAPSYDMCKIDCAATFPSLAAAAHNDTFVSCGLPASMTCDASGNNCTATPDSVLRQDGIVCGCASISLK